MYGWRARIGILVPASDTTCENEFRKMAPEGVSIHVSRMAFPGTNTPEALSRLIDEAEKAAKLLIPAFVNAIAFCCTSGSFIKGPGYDQEIIRRIKRVFPGTVTTTTTSVIEAFKALDIKRVAVASPYIDEINQALKRYLESVGIEVVSIKGLGIVKDTEVGKLTPEVAYELAKKIDRPEAQAVFISCTNFRSLEVIDILEKDLEKPVVTSNQATMWNLLRLLDIHGSIKRYGELFTLL